MHAHCRDDTPATVFHDFKVEQLLHAITTGKSIPGLPFTPFKVAPSKTVIRDNRCCHIDLIRRTPLIIVQVSMLETVLLAIAKKLSEYRCVQTKGAYQFRRTCLRTQSSAQRRRIIFLQQSLRSIHSRCRRKHDLCLWIIG